MRDYEELVERLRICPDYNDGCKNCPHEHDLGCRSTTMREAANAIEKLASNADKFKWISVEERLPDMKDSDWVIGVVNGYSKNIKYTDAVVMVAYDPEDGGWFLDDNPDASITVTHWMPLPEPPKEGTSDD